MKIGAYIMALPPPTPILTGHTIDLMTLALDVGKEEPSM